MKKIFLTIVFLIFSLNSFAELSPNSLSFDTQTLNTTSAEQPITLTNSLRGDINITSIDASDNFAQTNNCGNSVAPRENCTISITFTPTTAGTNNGTLTVVSDSGTEQVELTGTGEEAIQENQKPTASFTVTPESGDAPLTVKLDASTSTDLDGNETIESYQWVSSDDQSISDGKTASITFDTDDSYTITLTITDNKGATNTEEKTVIVSEKIVEKPTLSITATNGTVKCSTDGRTQENCESEYEKGTSLTITAETDTSYEFTGWDGDCSDNGDCQVIMNEDKTVTANFSKPDIIIEKFNLETTATNGTVKCSTDGRTQENCQSEYDDGTILTITAEPNPNADYEFTGWDGDCSGTDNCQVTMNANKTVTANFESEVIIKKFNLEITATNGTVECSTDGGAKGSCQSEYDDGTILTITVEPNADYEFTNWSDDCSDSDDCQVTMDENKTVSAEFELIDTQKPIALFTITVDSDNPLKVNLDASDSSDDGTITSYEWTSTNEQSISNGEKTSVTFNEAGSHEITLTVTDDKGKNDTKQQFVIVGYPQIEQVFSINNDSRTTTAQFYGGISLNDDSFVSELTSSDVITKGKDTIAIEGVIIPEHTGQAEIIVVGLYTPPNTEAVEDKCNPANGYYYMLTDSSMTNNYCQWDVVEPNNWCNTLNQTPRRRENTEYATRWDGKLDSLQPLFTDVELIKGQAINLTKERVLYRDIPAYTGHVCLTFGYRLDDIIIFNGEPIEFDVVE